MVEIGVGRRRFQAFEEMVATATVVDSAANLDRAIGWLLQQASRDAGLSPLRVGEQIGVSGRAIRLMQFGERPPRVPRDFWLRASDQLGAAELLDARELQLRAADTVTGGGDDWDRRTDPTGSPLYMQFARELKYAVGTQDLRAMPIARGRLVNWCRSRRDITSSSLANRLSLSDENRIMYLEAGAFAKPRSIDWDRLAGELDAPDLKAGIELYRHFADDPGQILSSPSPPAEYGRSSILNRQPDSSEIANLDADEERALRAFIQLSEPGGSYVPLYDAVEKLLERTENLSLEDLVGALLAGHQQGLIEAEPVKRGKASLERPVGRFRASELGHATLGPRPQT